MLNQSSHSKAEGAKRALFEAHRNAENSEAVQVLAAGVGASRFSEAECPSKALSLHLLSYVTLAT